MSVGDLWLVISNKQLVEVYDKHNELIWRWGNEGHKHGHIERKGTMVNCRIYWMFRDFHLRGDEKI